MNSNSKPGWSVVALAAIGVAGFVAIFWLVPKGDNSARMALLGVVTVLANAVVNHASARRMAAMRETVDEVKKQVNGRMSALIAAKTQTVPSPRPPSPGPGLLNADRPAREDDIDTGVIPIVGKITEGERAIGRHHKNGGTW